ncbi:MAG: prepilin-type N-terminal cleavage/methylation domain-containing protein [Acutalibacteraceae bacterium]
MKKLTKLNQLKQDKKGFTLIEIVIVLVIIAILSAMLVPSMMGWIDDSKKKSFLQEARSALTATQAEIANMYVAGETNIPTSFVAGSSYLDGVSKKVGRTVAANEISWTLDGDEIDTFTYTGEKYTVTWDGDKWGEVTQK